MDYLDKSIEMKPNKSNVRQETDLSADLKVLEHLEDLERRLELRDTEASRLSELNRRLKDKVLEFKLINE
jgi:Flp pilus assembly CpaE family ATPase